MSTYVKNVWTIKGIESKEKRDYILNKLATQRPIYEGACEKEWIINFDLIVPEPRFKQDCSKEYKNQNESAITEPDTKDRPWFNWYRWRNKHWYTKWNALERLHYN